MSDEDRTAKVFNTLKQLHDSHPHSPLRDMKKYFDCFIKEARFLGTQEDDHWTMNEYKRYIVPMYNPDTHAGVVPARPVEELRKISFIGDHFASFDEILHGVDENGVLHYEVRGSGTLVLDPADSMWKIALYHLSVPIPNEAALSVCQYLQQPHPYPSIDDIGGGSDDDDDEIIPSSKSSKRKKKKSKK